MSYTVPTLSIVFMVLAVLGSVAIPLVLFFVFRKRYKADRMPFWIGAAGFVLFSIVLEGLLKTLILASSFGKVIQGNIWLLGPFGGLMAGLFRETGSYVAFKTVLKKRRKNDYNALMYAAGYAGMEALLLLFVSNALVSLLFNAGILNKLIEGITNQAALTAVNNMFATLANTPPLMFLMDIVGQFGAVAVRLSCSVLVWIAAKDGKRFWLYPLAILLYTLVHAIAVILARYVPTSLWIVTVVGCASAAGWVLLAWWAWRRYLAQGHRP